MVSNTESNNCQVSSVQIEEKCEKFWSYGTSVCEAGLVGDIFSLEMIGERKFYVKVGASTKEQPSYFEYLVNNKHLHRVNRIEYKGDINSEQSSYNFSPVDGNFIVSVKALPVIIRDNDFIESYLEEVFGSNKSFIKEYLAVYVYTNNLSLPTIILTGERGTGKNTFAEAIHAIFPALSDTAKDLDGNFNPFAEKKLLIIDESESSGKLQYQLLKKFSGQKYLEVNKKYLQQYQVRNNLNIIFLSNKDLPIYVERDEIPKNDKNNQFFVFRMKSPTTYDPDFQQKLIDRLGNYIRTELKVVFNNLDLSGYRYSIAVPITEEEKKLFDNSITDIEEEADRIVGYIEERIYDQSWLDLKFVQSGYLPTSLLDNLIKNHRINKRAVIQNLQKHGYLTNDKADKYLKIGDRRPYSYKLGSMWLTLLKKQHTQKTSNVPIHVIPERHENRQNFQKTGTL